MTTSMISLELLAIRQHVLRECGVTSWALKTHRLNTLVNSCHSRFNCKSNISTPNLIVNNSSEIINANVSYQKIANNNVAIDNGKKEPKDSSGLVVDFADTLTNALPNHNHETNDSIRSDNNALVVDTSHSVPERFLGIFANLDKFELVAISYQNWVILADNLLMTADEKNIWQSLANRLSQTPATFTLQVKYPMVENDYPQYENFKQGSHCLLGFLLRLCHDKESLKIATLTALPDGIDLGNLKPYCQVVPLLSQMVQFADAKKFFWQLLHQS